jgi:predicted acetyltransferase
MEKILQNKQGEKDQLRLVKPDLRYEQSFMTAFNSLKNETERMAWIYLGESGYSDFFKMSFKSYVDTLLAREVKPPPHFVCDTVLWAILGDVVVGRISIRHELNDWLSKIGGHIGYIVASTHRKRGLATQMLELILETSKAKEIGSLLLTCDEDNVGSEKTILKNNGVFESLIAAGEGKASKKRFWIHVRTS